MDWIFLDRFGVLARWNLSQFSGKFFLRLRNQCRIYPRNIPAYRQSEVADLFTPAQAAEFIDRKIALSFAIAM